MGKLNDHFRNSAPSEIINPLVKGQVMRNLCLMADVIQHDIQLLQVKKKSSESLYPYLSDLQSFLTPRKQR